ncbi:hypothetical protein [Polaromonas sp. CG9_12]|nr:hypothetical protein [Polaromonas sp. CG9_12]
MDAGGKLDPIFLLRHSPTQPKKTLTRHAIRAWALPARAPVFHTRL